MNKAIIIATSLSCFVSSLLNASVLDSNFSLNTTNTWVEFNLQNNDLASEKCAWISMITFKSKNALKLNKMNLQWTGNFIDTNKISASLYNKKSHEDLLVPIEENHVCDGIWNKEKQQIIFDLDEKLVAINKYYLVISFPDEVKGLLKTGSFTLTKNKSLNLLPLNRE